MELNNKAAKMKVIIVGGMAGGASCAARLRRSGQRAYTAKRILLQNGYQARTFSGGMPARTVHSLTSS
jgi:flavin-dependent dehydrogenase